MFLNHSDRKALFELGVFVLKLSQALNFDG